MEPGQSRVGAGRARAFTAKTAVGVGAVGAFAIFALLARASHASNQHKGAGSVQDLRTPSSFLSSLQQGSNDFGGGQIAPAGGPPQVATGTS